MAEKIIHTILNKGTNFVDRCRKNIRLGDILRLCQRGSSYREIGLIVKCSKQSVGKRLRDWEKSKSKQQKP